MTIFASRWSAPPIRPGSPTRRRRAHKTPDSLRGRRPRRLAEATMTEPETYLFDDDGAIPNSRLPLLVYRATLPADPRAIEQCFAANRWPPAWRAGVHPYHHFHA